MMEGMVLRAVYQEWLGRLEQELQPAYLQGKQECVQCGLCCARRPCIPTPDELKAIAEFLGMELEEAVGKYFVGDRLNGSNVEYIFPAKHSQKDIVGTYLPWRRTFDEGYCIFFDEEVRACTIEAVKPASAKNQKCWVISDTGPIALESWSGVDIASYGITRPLERAEE